MAIIAENFKKRVVEGRFTALTFSIMVLAMRFLLFHFHGVPEWHFPDTGFLWQYVASFFANPLISFGFSTFFVFLIAYLIVALNSRFSLIRTRTSLPFVVPLFLFSLHPMFLVMTPDLVSILLMLISLFPLLGSYQQPDTQPLSFRTAILIGLAGLFQIYALLLLPLWWRGEVLMRGVQPKSFFTFVFGVFLVYFSVFSVYFVFDNVSGFVAPFLFFAQLPPIEIPYFSVIEWIGITLFFVLFVLYMLSAIQSVRTKMLTLSSTKFIVFVVVFSLIFQVVYWRETVFFFLLSVSLTSYLIAYYHSVSMSKKHVYYAYLMMILLTGVYTLNLLVFMGL